MAYAEHREDEYLFNLINAKGLTIPPYFVEIGACDGIHISNCRLFAENGWGGIFVEPNAHYFGQLEQNYEHRQDILTIQAAVSDHAGIETFYRYPNNVDLSGLHEKPLYSVYYADKVKIVEAANLTQKEVGIMSIDVEGHEQVILKNLFTLKKYPCIMIVESNTMQDRKEQIELLNEHYHLLNVFDINTIWIRRDLWL